jgi:small conductance mechanosensitive channel
VFHARHVPIGTAHLLSKLTSWAIIAFGIITALQRFFDVTAFLAGLGILGLTVGFALQDTIKNLAGGIILLVQQPIQIGEVVGAAGFDGTVLNISLRTTEMETTDGRIVILPNANILNGAIINYTRAKRARVNFNLTLPQGADPATARQMVMDVIQSVAGYVPEPAPQVVFNNLTGRTLELTAGFWVDLTKNNSADAKDAAIVKITDALLQPEGTSASPRRHFLLAAKQK